MFYWFVYLDHDLYNNNNKARFGRKLWIVRIPRVRGVQTCRGCRRSTKNTDWMLSRFDRDESSPVQCVRRTDRRGQSELWWRTAVTSRWASVIVRWVGSLCVVLCWLFVDFPADKRHVFNDSSSKYYHSLFVDTRNKAHLLLGAAWVAFSRS